MQFEKKSVLDKYIIFGAGSDGKEVFQHIDKNRVQYFCDNDLHKVGTVIGEKKVISFEHLVDIKDDYVIILAISDKQSIKKQFSDFGITNYIEYISDGMKKAKYIIDKNFFDSDINALLDSFVNKDIDSISNFAEFKNILIECKNKLNGRRAYYTNIKSESILYGHDRALMEYAGIDYSQRAYFPEVAHATFFYGQHWDYHTAAIFSNQYDKEIHNDHFPYIPIFSVGPYIHYAKVIYSDDKIKKIKEKNGKTVLIFVIQSVEYEKCHYNNNEVIERILKYKEKYDTVMVSAYWLEADNDMYTFLESEGIKIVSAGFRFDYQFINRLRTIFELADDVVSFGVSSAICYSLSLGKNTNVYNINESYSSIETGSLNKVIHCWETDEFKINNIFYDKFGDSDKKLLEQEIKLLNKCYGFNQIKTPSEIRTICEVSKRIWENSNLEIMNYPIGVYKTYNEYQKDYDMEKLHMLTDALGKGFINN